jgi:hypothetical protein
VDSDGSSKEARKEGSSKEARKEGGSKEEIILLHFPFFKH